MTSTAVHERLLGHQLSSHNADHWVPVGQLILECPLFLLPSSPNDGYRQRRITRAVKYLFYKHDHKLTPY